MRRTVGGLVAAIGVLAAPAGAAYAPTQRISQDDRTAASPAAAPLPGGATLIAWAGAPNSSSPRRVDAVVRGADGSLGPVQELATGDPGTRVAVASAADGSAVLTWTDATTLRAARRAPDGTLTVLGSLPLPAGESASGAVVVAFGGTTAYVGYTTSQFNGGGFTLRLRAARVSPADDAPVALGGVLETLVGAFGTSESIVLGDAVPDGAGRVLLGWATQFANSPSPPRVNTTTTRAVIAEGDAIGSPVTMDSGAMGWPDLFSPETGTSVGVPDFAAGSGRVTAAWQRTARPDGITVIRWRRVDPGALTGADADTLHFPAPMSLSLALAAAPELAIDSDATTVAVFTRLQPPITARATAATLPAAGPPSVPVQIPGVAANAEQPSVATVSGGVEAAWRRSAGNNADHAIVATTRPTGGSFAAAEVVSGEATTDPEPEGATIVSSASGSALVWAGISDATGRQQVHLARRDAAAPVLGTVDVPASAMRGEGVAMSATASDDGPAPTITWDFGDGTTATGGSVRHAFADAGAFVVTVRATDEAGNVATEQRVVAVAAPGPAPAPPVAPAPADVTPASTNDIRGPVVQSFRASPSRFRVASRSTATISQQRRSRPARRGTTLIATVDERSTIVVQIRRGTRVVATLVRRRHGPGAIRIPFTGRVSGRALPPGRFRARLTAIDGAGNRSRARSAPLRIVSR